MRLAYTSFGESMVEGLCRVLHQTCAYWGRETVSVDQGKGANECLRCCGRYNHLSLMCIYRK